MNKAIDIADYIVNYCIDNNKKCTHYDLQKILYLLYKEHALQYGVRIFTDLIFPEASGPIVRSVFSKYCIFGGMPIRIKTVQEYPDLEDIDYDLLYDIIDKITLNYPWNHPVTRDDYWKEKRDLYMKRKEKEGFKMIESFDFEERIVVPLNKQKTMNMYNDYTMR